MTAYCFFDVLEFTDPAKIEKYRAGAAATVAQYGGRYLIAGGKCDVVEGTWRPTYPVTTAPSERATAGAPPVRPPR